MFTFLTKRPERLIVCLPADWEDGYENVTIGCTIENQSRADFRLPIFLSVPMIHRCLMVEPMLGPMEISQYLASGLIDYVSAGGESGQNVRPLDFDWIKSLYIQCLENGVDFHFHQTGANFIKVGRHYDIPRRFQHSQAEKAMSVLKGWHK